MEAMSVWLINNKEWFFSGGGIVLVSWIGRIIFRRMRDSSTQTIRSGDNSKNVQAGRDVYIGTKKKSADVE